MAVTNDGVSKLPDAVLHYILSLVPMKFAIRTSILSKRWNNLWKHTLAYATDLDFGAEFGRGQSPGEFVSNVDRYLQLHEGKIIKMFKLSFYAGDQYMAKIERWVEFSVARGVKELDLDFCQTIDGEMSDSLEEGRLLKLPNCLFSTDSLTHLKLSGCDFSPPLNSNGFSKLKAFHLCNARITEGGLKIMVFNCKVLEELSLKNCYDLMEIKVSAPHLPLTSLIVVDCWDAHEIEISVPNLQSFHFYGNLIDINLENSSILEDVLINGLDREGFEPDHDWIRILRRLEHVKILTLCNSSLSYVVLAEEYTPEYLPVTFHNLGELQLLMDSAGGCYLANTYSFFKNCPCPRLEKLFIELPSAYTEPSQRNYHYSRIPEGDSPEMAFPHLKTVKVNGFRGFENEIWLVKFFLERAIALDSLLLVAPPKGIRNEREGSTSDPGGSANPLDLLFQKLGTFRKASSDAEITICEYSEGGDFLSPTHMEVFCKG
ncbi:hypothetical protein ACLOJK_041880 [Asimina triloba]